MVWLATPALAEEFLVLAVTWTDWWLTGHFFHTDGDATKMAMSMMGYVMWLIPSLFAAVAIGATAIVARYVGSDQPELATRAANQAFIVGGGVAAMLLSTALLFGEDFLELMQLHGTAKVFAQQYFDIVVWSIPFVMFSIVGAACLRGAGDMVTGFIVKSIVVVTNIAISFSLVTGWGAVSGIWLAGIGHWNSCRPHFGRVDRYGSIDSRPRGTAHRNSLAKTSLENNWQHVANRLTWRIRCGSSVV